MVYDISSRASFENVKEVWYPEIKNYGERFKLISLVGNKCDKYEEEEVPLQEAKDYAKEINAKFFLISANDGTGINEMFETLADNYFDENFMDLVNKSKEDRIDSSGYRTLLKLTRIAGDTGELGSETTQYSPKNQQ